MNFHMIHYTQIIWDEVAFIWKVTGKAVAIFMTGTVLYHLYSHVVLSLFLPDILWVMT